jgi:hypothetical protein
VAKRITWRLVQREPEWKELRRCTAVDIHRAADGLGVILLDVDASGNCASVNIALNRSAGSTQYVERVSPPDPPSDAAQ